MARLIERCKHIEVFAPEIPKLRAVYAEAWAAGRVVADGLGPGHAVRALRPVMRPVRRGPFDGASLSTHQQILAAINAFYTCPAE